MPFGQVDRHIVGLCGAAQVASQLSHSTAASLLTSTLQLSAGDAAAGSAPPAS